MTSANNLDPNEAPQTWGLISDPNCLTLRLYLTKIWMEIMRSLQILKEKESKNVRLNMARDNYLLEEVQIDNS